VLIGTAILGYACVVAFVRSNDDIVFVLSLLAAGLALQSLLVIAAVPSGGSLTLGPVQIKPFFERAGGSFGSANVLASFVTLGLASSLSLIAMRVSTLKTMLGWAATALGVVALLLTQSRGGWIGSGIALTIFTLAALKRKWISKKMLLTWGIAGGAALGIFGAAVLTRLSEFNNSAALARLPLNRLALGVIADHPILGSGANNFAAAMSSHLTVDYSTAWISTVHNKYLLVWAETGLLGLGSFLAFMGGVLWCGRLLWKSTDPLLSPLGAAVTAAFAGTMAHMAVEIFHARVQYQMIWIVAATVHAALMVERNARQMGASTFDQLTDATGPPLREVGIQPNP
jgi:O-antigen ligase